MSRYRGNVGNLLQHWVLCELLAECNRRFDQIRFVDAYSMAPLATERFNPRWSAHLFDHVRDRTSEETPYERAWRQVVQDGAAYPNSALLLTAMWRGNYSLLLCESDPAAVDELTRWTVAQQRSPGCVDVEIAGGDWRERFESPVSTSDTLTYFSFDPDMFDRHGSHNPRIMGPADLGIVAAAVKPIRGTVLVQLSTYSANHANGQEAVSEAIASGLGYVGLTLLARVRTDGQMMSSVLGRHAETLTDIPSLPDRFDSWLRSVKAQASSPAKGLGTRGQSTEESDTRTTLGIKRGTTSMNFQFLGNHKDARLLELASRSEAGAWRDPSAAVMHAGRLAERMVERALQGTPDVVLAHQVDRIQRLQTRVHVDRSVIEGLNRIRILRNMATHNNPEELKTVDALCALRDLLGVAQWFDVNFGPDRPPGFHYERFSEPQNPEEPAGQSALQGTLVAEPITPESLASVADRKQVSIESLADLERAGLSPDWVYFATPVKADRDATYDFAYSDGILCSAVFKSTGDHMPRVKDVQAGNTILLAFGEDADYEARLLLRVDAPTGAHVGKAKAMAVLQNINQLWNRLREAGYSIDLTAGGFTGFQVTASTDLFVRGQTPKFTRPPSQNTLRSWRDLFPE